jgi:hypothetical protein
MNIENNLKTEKAPIVLFVYNRLDKTKKTLEALNDNIGADESVLYIYSDGARNDENKNKVLEIREYIENNFIPVSKFKKVVLVKSEVNNGLAKSIINGVTEIVNRYGMVIVLEDDLVTSKYFLTYMNSALYFYEKYPQIGSVSGYSYPIKSLKHYRKDIFIIHRAESWGWGTWKDRWGKVDWKVSDYEDYKKDTARRKQYNSLVGAFDLMLCLQMEKNLDSWLVRWHYHFFKNNLNTVYPKNSLVNNIGCDASGVHCSPTDKFLVELNETEKLSYKFEILPVNKKMQRKIVMLENEEKTFWELAVNKIKRIIKKL